MDIVRNIWQDISDKALHSSFHLGRILAMMEEAPGKQGQCFCKLVGVVKI